jgi:hypothetical protein
MPAASKFLPKLPGALIKVSASDLYENPDVEKLERINVVRFVNAEWVRVGSYSNEDPKEKEIELKFPPLSAAEAVFRGGESFPEPWNIQALLTELEHIQVVAQDVPVTIFDKKLEDKEVTTTVKIPADSAVNVYRKKYTLRVTLWFQLYLPESEDPISIRMNPYRCSKLIVTDQVELNSNEFWTTQQVLSDEEPDYIKITPEEEYRCCGGRAVKDCTYQCLSYLTAHGARCTLK